MTQIQGSIAVVTGGASGIGRGIAEQLIAEGASVVIADLDADRVVDVAAEIGATGVAVDVSDADSVSRLADQVVAQFGRVDIVVNNAGVGPQGRMIDLTLDDWHWIMNVNFYGVVHGVHSFLPLLLNNENGGHIVNTASMAVFLPLEGLGAYVASKMGVLGMSQVLHDELASDGSNVHVSVLPPGPVRTNIKDSLRHRPEGLDGNLTDVDLESNDAAADLRWIDPIDAGRIVSRAIRNNDFLAVTHPEWWPLIDARNKLTQASFEKYPAADYA
jgi:NAD(P)-dependent dehydrogenase (short-subunit alcohol dehydrogenase family)